MKGYSTKEIMSPEFDMPKDYNELVKVYRTLAKSADQRLVRLEKYANEPNMGNAMQWSYARAMHDIKDWSGDEANRFNTAPPAKKTSLLSKIRDIQTFLDAPTSTKKGIKNVYQKRANSINKKYGTDFTWEDIGDFFESNFYKKLDESYASDTIVRAIGKMVKNEAKIKEAIEEMKKEKKKPKRDRTIIHTGSKVVNDVISDIVSSYPEEVKELLNK